MRLRVEGWPITTNVFTSDLKTKTYNFRVGRSDQYHVGCTVRDDEVGLIHLSVIRSDLRRQLALADQKEGQ